MKLPIPPTNSAGGLKCFTITDANHRWQTDITCTLPRRSSSLRRVAAFIAASESALSVT
ncbi:hypothetical protein KCP73_06230 [Salmonella enterica subsp. enterica]|nr:hypothetical protein KCP73_06230 [Salmonella enterica subsp. enterica]